METPFLEFLSMPLIIFDLLLKTAAADLERCACVAQPVRASGTAHSCSHRADHLTILIVTLR